MSDGFVFLGFMALMTGIVAIAIWGLVVADKARTAALLEISRAAFAAEAEKCEGAHISPPTPEQVHALAWAMWQLLDDMGEQGTCVCLAAKAQARIAYEPFWQAEKAAGTDIAPMEMPLSDAEAIMERQ